MKKERTTGSYEAPALDKGLEIIEFLADQAIPHGTLDIAAALGRSRNEIYRMLLVLERRGYLKRVTDDKFMLSNRLFDYGMRLPPRRNLHDAALSNMHRLSLQLFQSCHLAVPSGNDMVVVARVESPGFLGFAVRVGYRRPIVESASGRILFAFLPSADRKDWLADLAQGAEDPDVDKFLADCGSVVANGYHIGASRFVDAVTDIAVPIFDGTAPGASAALSMPFVSGRAAKSTILEAVAALRECANTISSDLRHG